VKIKANLDFNNGKMTSNSGLASPEISENKPALFGLILH